MHAVVSSCRKFLQTVFGLNGYIFMGKYFQCFYISVILFNLRHFCSPHRFCSPPKNRSNGPFYDRSAPSHRRGPAPCSSSALISSPLLQSKLWRGRRPIQLHSKESLSPISTQASLVCRHHNVEVVVNIPTVWCCFSSVQGIVMLRWCTVECPVITFHYFVDIQKQGCID